jgi:hypothetical protein
MTVSDYDKLEEQYGLSENGNKRIPCDVEGCEGMSERDYGFGVAPSIIKGGHKYSTEQYRAAAEEEWLRNEVYNSKRVNKRGGPSPVRPYANYHLKNPEAAGFKKLTEDQAKTKANNAKEALGEKWANVQNARKK